MGSDYYMYFLCMPMGMTQSGQILHSGQTWGKSCYGVHHLAHSLGWYLNTPYFWDPFLCLLGLFDIEWANSKQ